MPKTIIACIVIVLLTIAGSSLYIHNSKYDWMKKGIDVQYAAWLKWEQTNKDRQTKTLESIQEEFRQGNKDLRDTMADLHSKMSDTEAQLKKKDFNKVYDEKGRARKQEGAVHLGSEFSDTWNDITRNLSK